MGFLQWALPLLELRWPGFRKVRGQVCKRISRRVAELGLGGLEQYRTRLEADAAEWERLDELCRITISRLHRDRHVFELIRGRVLPELAALGPVRVWSAGCASGEEPWSIRLAWEEVAGGSVDILATDVEPGLLERARRGCYGPGSRKEVPPAWEPLLPGGCVREDLRGGVRFVRQDLRSELPAGPFDLVLCRNLAFTYFAPELQRETLRRICTVLRPGGYLVIGAHERLPAEGLREVAPCIYRLPPGPAVATKAG